MNKETGLNKIHALSGLYHVGKTILILPFIPFILIFLIMLILAELLFDRPFKKNSVKYKLGPIT